MTELKYKLTNDILFKMLFVKNPDLLKRLVAELLGLRFESIGEFVVVNAEMAPEVIGDKFCRLDINMKVEGQMVDLEIQVNDDGDYPERTLYYWAREYSTSLSEGKDYSELPRTVIISIIAFKLFECTEYHSEYQVLEATRHTPISDRLCLHYYELQKLPDVVNEENLLELWLKLFKAETKEELAKIEALEVPVMKQAIEAYNSVAASPEFRELERMRSKARHDEAQALKNAARLGEERAEQRANEKWQAVVADKDAALADKDVLISQLRAQLKKN